MFFIEKFLFTDRPFVPKPKFNETKINKGIFAFLLLFMFRPTDGTFYLLKKQLLPKYTVRPSF